MKIVITGTDTFECLSIEKPEPGMVYQLEDTAEGTGPQNRAFHALVQEYWRSGCHSYNVKSFSELQKTLAEIEAAGNVDDLLAANKRAMAKYANNANAITFILGTYAQARKRLTGGGQ